MPYVSYGEMDKATDTAVHNLSVLEPLLSTGYGIVSTEPKMCIRDSFSIVMRRLW